MTIIQYQQSITIKSAQNNSIIPIQKEHLRPQSKHSVTCTQQNMLSDSKNDSNDNSNNNGKNNILSELNNINRINKCIKNSSFNSNTNNSLINASETTHDIDNDSNNNCDIL